jgi:hypothetical protein
MVGHSSRGTIPFEYTYDLCFCLCRLEKCSSPALELFDYQLYSRLSVNQVPPHCGMYTPDCLCSLHRKSKHRHNSGYFASLSEVCMQNSCRSKCPTDTKSSRSKQFLVGLVQQIGNSIFGTLQYILEII